MFELRMILTTREDGAKVLRLSAGFRVAFALIAAFILVGSYTTGSLAVLPGILAFLSLLAVFYDERWIFDMDSKEATRHFGLVFLHRTRTYSLERAEYFEYASFLEGSGPSAHSSGSEDRAGGAGPMMKPRPFQRRFETLSLITSDGDRLDVDKQRSRSTGQLRDIGEKLADYCNVPLREE